MSAPFLASITLLGGGGAQPKGGGTHLAMITPLGGGHADIGGPGWQGGLTDPGYGIDTGGGEHPWLPGAIGGGGRPDNGVPVPPEMWPPQPPPPLPPHLEPMVVVAVHRPGVTEWRVTAYPVPQPKG